MVVRRGDFKMSYYNTCPNCGANLDPGEPCDCVMEREKRERFFESVTSITPKTRQLSFSLNNREVVDYEKTAY